MKPSTLLITGTVALTAIAVICIVNQNYSMRLKVFNVELELRPECKLWK